MYEAEITQYIQNVLQRDPHPGEVEAWQAVIDSGSSLEDVRDLIIDSSEAVNDVYPVILAYQAVYGRLPDAGGLDYWTGVYKAALGQDNPNTPDVDESGPSLDDPNTPTINEAMVETLRAFVDPAQTPEFVNRFGADPTGDQFVAAAYQNVLNRAPDQAGLNYWQGRYAQEEAKYANDHPDASQSDIDIAVRSLILEQFVDSAEYKTSTADEVDQFLANAADGADGAYSGSLWDLQDHTGQTFILTPDADLGAQAGQPFYGTDGDDTYIAGTVNTGIFSGNTLGTGDALNGAGGNDTLEISDGGSFTALTPRIENIENVSIQALGGIAGGTAVDMTNAQGVEQITNEHSNADVEVFNIQNEVALSVHDTDSDLDASFAPGVDFGGDLNISVDGAGSGVAGDRARIFVSTDDDTLTTLNVNSTGEESFVRVDVDDDPTGSGTHVQFETLNITGDADLNLRDRGGEFDHVTTVNVDSTGGVNLDFNDNLEDVTYNGANGSGDDFLRFNNGSHSNTIDTGAGDDTVQVWGAGNQTVNLGDGDDSVLFGYNADVNDSADGGAGTDTIGIEAGTLGGLTATAAFAGQISGFEQVYAWNDVDQGDSVTVNLANLDNINHVITDGTDASTAVAEQQVYDFDGAGAFGGSLTVEGVTIDVPANALSSDVAQLVADNFAAIKAAYETNHTGEILDSMTVVNNDQVQFDFAQLSGNVPAVNIVANTGPLTGVAAGAFGAAVTTTPGTNPISEWQHLTIDTAPTTNGTVTVTLDADAGGVQNIAVVGGESTIETAQRIATALDALPNVDAVVEGTSIVHIDYDASLGNEGLVAFAPGTTSAAATASAGVDGQAPVQEVQTVQLNDLGSDADGGFVRVSLSGSSGTGFVDIKVDPGLSEDELGFAIQAQASAIVAAIPEIASVSYDTGTDQLTFTSTLAAGDINPIAVAGTPGNFPDLYDEVASPGTTIPGVDGDLGGQMTLNNMQSGGTLELADSNNGDTYVNLTSTLPTNDSFNIVLDADSSGNAIDHNGQVHLAGIEALNISQMADTVSNLGLDADDTTTMTVSGVGGVDFGLAGFDSLTSFDASGVTGAGSDGAVRVVTDADANTSLTGGAGNDWLVGSDNTTSGSHVDTINGGVGDDHIFGRAGNDILSGGDGADHLNGGVGADTLTGGAGNDTFVYTAVADSQGTTSDTITDFTSGSDTIDLSAVAMGGSSSYLGEANGYGAVLTSLSNDGSTHAVLDTSTSTLYVDVNGDGVLDNNDMAINLTGVTDLTNDVTHLDIAF